MEDKCYMAIDPGERGFIALQQNGVFKHYSILDNDLYQLSEIMAEIKSKYPRIVCVVEDVHAIFGSSAKSTFGFGFNKGYLIGLLAASKIPYVLVQPKIWQKEMWINSDMIVNYKKISMKKKDGSVRETTRKEVDTKNTSFNAAKRLFPNMDFRRTERCKNFDDNKVDATLMSEYARRKNL